MITREWYVHNIWYSKLVCGLWQSPCMVFTYEIVLKIYLNLHVCTFEVAVNLWFDQLITLHELKMSKDRHVKVLKFSFKNKAIIASNLTESYTCAIRELGLRPHWWKWSNRNLLVTFSLITCKWPLAISNCSLILFNKTWVGMVVILFVCFFQKALSLSLCVYLSSSMKLPISTISTTAWPCWVLPTLANLLWSVWNLNPSSHIWMHLSVFSNWASVIVSACHFLSISHRKSTFFRP